MNHLPPALGGILASHDPGPEYAVVACINCPAVARIDDSARLSDAQIIATLSGMGWSVRPTLCPDHRRALRGEDQ